METYSDSTRTRTGTPVFTDDGLAIRWLTIGPCCHKGDRRESNPQPVIPQTTALPIELQPQFGRGDLNSQLLAYQTSALPIELHPSADTGT